jgi:hypothetical protein
MDYSLCLVLYFCVKKNAIADRFSLRTYLSLCIKLHIFHCRPSLLDATYRDRSAIAADLRLSAGLSFAPPLLEFAARLSTKKGDVARVYIGP